MKNQNKALCTVTLAIVNTLVFFVLSLGGQTEDGIYMVKHGAMYPPYILEYGQYYRLFTSMFLHFGFFHLMNNMVVLLALGWNLERAVGRIRFLMIYFLSGFGGNLLSLLKDVKNNMSPVSAGASGAIFGMTGAMLCLVILNHGRVGEVTRQGMIGMTFITLYSGFVNGGVDNFAHIGGLLTGAAVVLLMGGKRNLHHGTTSWS